MMLRRSFCRARYRTPMTIEGRPRVLLTDDYPGILAALQCLLTPDCDVVGSVRYGGAVLEASRRPQPDVIVLDSNMPGANGPTSVASVGTPATRRDTTGGPRCGMSQGPKCSRGQLKAQIMRETAEHDRRRARKKSLFRQVRAQVSRPAGSHRRRSPTQTAVSTPHRRREVHPFGSVPQGSPSRGEADRLTRVRSPGWHRA